MKKEIWKNPQKEPSLDQSQSPLWFWNDRLEKKELLRQLELKSSVGVKCTIPHARTNGGEGFIGGYLDEEWFAHIRTVMEYKKEHNEPVWLYDEIDWPAGTCNQTITLDEQNREQYLTFEAVTIKAGEKFRAQLSDLRKQPLYELSEDSDFTACAFNVFIVSAKTEEAYDITKYFTYSMFGPELEFVSEEDAVAYIVKINVDAYKNGGNEAVNYLDGAVTKKFLASTYDVYYEHCGEYFGKTIQAVFNDETRMCHAFAWCEDFPEVFLERKGYDLLRYIYLLPLPGTEAGRVRCDYFDVLAWLYQNRYFGELHQWCEARKIKLFAHLLGEETIFGHARYSGDYLRQNRYLDIPGADHLGKGIGSLNIKYTSCGAHSYGKELSAVEVFAGCGWSLTFEEYIRMITWMFQQGMQVIINHGFFYSDRGERKNDWPPSQFFQWQGFDRMQEGNNMVRRLHYALTGGYNEADVLVYYPIETFWLHYLPDNHFTHGFFQGPYVKDERAAYIDTNLQMLLNGLLSENLDFDMIHRDALENFAVEGNQIVNRLTGQHFSVLLLPMCEILSLETAVLCADFIANGGVILAIEDVPYMGMEKGTDAKVKAIMKELVSNPQFKVLGLEDIKKIYQDIRMVIPQPIRIIEGCAKTENNHPVYGNGLIDPYIHTGEDISGVMFNRYRKENDRHTLFMNYGTKEEQILVRAEGAKEPLTVWDTMTGEAAVAEIVKKEPDAYILRLTLPVTHGIVLVSEVGGK